MTGVPVLSGPRSTELGVLCTRQAFDFVQDTAVATMLRVEGARMKRIILLAILSIVLLSPLFAETLTCEESFVLGKFEASEEHKVWGWKLLGVGSGLFAGFAVVKGNSFAGIAASAAVYIPAFLLPAWRSIPEPSQPSENECYRAGYMNRQRQDNLRALAGGQLVGLGVGAVGTMVAMILIVWIVGQT